MLWNEFLLSIVVDAVASLAVDFQGFFRCAYIRLHICLFNHPAYQSKHRSILVLIFASINFFTQKKKQERDSSTVMSASKRLVPSPSQIFTAWLHLPSPVRCSSHPHTHHQICCSYSTHHQFQLGSQPRLHHHHSNLSTINHRRLTIIIISDQHCQISFLL